MIVGAGPSGSACAYWLARAGWSVCLVEKKAFPREKTCGDGLTPRSVRQLADMGLEGAVAAHGHRYRGLRAHGFGASLELAWPEHPRFPNYGYTITRFDLDGLVAGAAENAGALVLHPYRGPRPPRSVPRRRRDPRERSGRARARPGQRSHGRASRQLPRHRRRTELAEWAGPLGSSASRAGRWGWRCAATLRASATTSRGSTRTSTYVTSAASPYPATDGSSPSATDGST